MGFLSSIAPIVGGVGGAFLGGPAGAAAGVSLGSAISSAQGAAEQNQMNEKMAYDQMNFQREMSNTAHQREIADLKAAGLNPILSAGGGGASAPSGASAQMVNQAPDFSHAVSSAVEAKTATQNLENLKTQKELADAQKTKTEFDAWDSENKARISLLNKSADEQMYAARNGLTHVNDEPVSPYYKQLAQVEKNEFSARSTEARRAAADNQYGLDHSKLLNIMDTVQKGANVLSTGASAFKPYAATTGQIKDNRETHYHVNKTTGEIKP